MSGSIDETSFIVAVCECVLEVNTNEVVPYQYDNAGIMEFFILQIVGFNQKIHKIKKK